LADLPTTSLEGITGVWSPAIDNTTTTTYTFTPDAGQCVSTILTELTVVVNPIVTPTFDAVADICSGDTLADLPTTSLESITGVWSPAIDNTTTTTYTFTPDDGQCASTTLTELTITVNPIVTPTFDSVAEICSEDTLADLPTTSLEGITGVWSPAIDNTTTTTYTFTPDDGQCVPDSLTTLEIVVNEPTEPDFEALSAICSGETAPTLESTSPNGITGTWSPDTVSNTSSGEYIFTPDADQCALSLTLSMTVNEETLTSVECVTGEAFSGNHTIVVTVTSSEGNYEYILDDTTSQSTNVFENVSSGTHTITVVDLNGCSDSITEEVLIVDYPKFFTPNGDGYNETWNVIGLEDQTNAKIYIYDRYGKLIKEFSPSDAGWDGTFNGSPLPSTDYWFLIDYLDGVNAKQFKAHFSLKR
jgi:gliding motility-associated-like protein